MKHLEEIVEKLKGELESSDQVRMEGERATFLITEKRYYEATLVISPVDHVS